MHQLGSYCSGNNMLWYHAYLGHHTCQYKEGLLGSNWLLVHWCSPLSMSRVADLEEALHNLLGNSSTMKNDMI